MRKSVIFLIMLVMSVSLIAKWGVLVGYYGSDGWPYAAI